MTLNGFGAGGYRLAHDLYPGRILNRADATFSYHSHDSYSALWRRDLSSSTSAPSLRADGGRRGARIARAGHARATISAGSDGEPQQGRVSYSCKAAAGRLEEARAGGGGESGSRRHGRRTWRKRLGSCRAFECFYLSHINSRIFNK